MPIKKISCGLVRRNDSKQGLRVQMRSQAGAWEREKSPADILVPKPPLGNALAEKP